MKEKNLENSKKILLQMPLSLKNRIAGVVYRKKLANEPNATQAQVVLELLEKGLSMVEPFTQKQNEVF